MTEALWNDMCSLLGAVFNPEVVPENGSLTQSSEVEDNIAVSNESNSKNMELGTMKEQIT